MGHIVASIFPDATRRDFLHHNREKRSKYPLVALLLSD